MRNGMRDAMTDAGVVFRFGCVPTSIEKEKNGSLRVTLSDGVIIEADQALMATGRLLGRIPEDPGRYLGGLNVLGQPLWSPAGPNGFPDTNAAWAAPEGMKLRLDISAQVASRLADNIDPRDLLELAAADAASPETRRAVERAETRQQALALLLMSPEFQRR